MHLGQVIVGARLFGIGQAVCAALVGYLDEALFDVDVGRAVFAHGSQLDQVSSRADVCHGIEEVQGADHVVDLGVDGVRPVDHGVRGRPLLGVMHDGVGLELRQGFDQELRIGHVANEWSYGLVGHPRPCGQALVQVGDRNQAVSP